MLILFIELRYTSIFCLEATEAMWLLLQNSFNGDRVPALANACTKVNTI